MIDQYTEEVPTSGMITKVKENYIIINSRGNYQIYLEDTQLLNPGMNVSFDGYLYENQSYQIPNTFDYETYLKSQNIKGVMGCNQLMIESDAFSIHDIKYLINKHFEEHYNESVASYLKLFILGEKDAYYDNNSEQISSLGIAHLFAISGLHIGLLVGCISFFLKKLYLTKETNQLIILILLVIYNIMTGFKISILRASFLIIGIYLKDYFKILLTSTDLLSISFVGFLIYNPYLIYNIGFQLSYLIANSLILGNRMFKKDVYALKIIKISFLATIISLPIILSINRSIGLIFLGANLIFLVYVTFIFLPISVILLFIPKLQNVYQIIIYVFEYLLKLIDSINIDIEYSFSQPIYLVIYWIVLYILIISKNRKKRFITCVILILVVLSNSFIPFKSNTFVRFLDVGQGDSIHIHSGSCDLLIDTGDEDDYDTLVDYFKSYNIKEIDSLVITHFHQDHYGELTDLTNNFRINNIYLNNHVEGLNDYEIVSEGDQIYCGDLSFFVLSAYTHSSNENNNSIVLFSRIGNDNYLFTGDIESEIEEEIINSYHFDVDILKVPHHGSSTSSTVEFVNKLSPEIAVIQVGLNNSHGLPDDDVLSRYFKTNTNILRTDSLGTITIYYYNVMNLRIIETYNHKSRIRVSL